MVLFKERPDFAEAWAATEFHVLFAGMGNDTVMMIAEMYERGFEPDEVLFCDTGCEFPHTYQFLEYLQTWCAERSWSKVVHLRKFDKDGAALSVISQAEAARTLPSAAFGYKTCSVRFKFETAEVYLNNHPRSHAAWGVPGKGRPLKTHTGTVLQLVGINADEDDREAKWKAEHKWLVSYPLFDWDIGHKESAAVKRVGLYYPGKSSCYCCPHITGRELFMLAKDHPDLFERIVWLEAGYRANNDTTTGPKGLCRRDTIESKMRKYQKDPAYYDEFEDQICTACK